MDTSRQVSDVAGRKAWGAQAGHRVAAGSSEREFAGASAGGAWVRRLRKTPAVHDSHRTAAGAGADRRQCRCGIGAGVAGVPAGMMGRPTNTRVWIAAGVTDLRRGFTGLSALVESKLEEKPFSGHVFVFRGRRGDLIKVLWYDGDGLCLFAKRLEPGRFVWPQAASGTVSLTRA
jgi:transposase